MLAPHHGRAVDRASARLPAYRGETYYGLAALKPSPWNWTVSGYIFLAGMAGGMQTIAALGQHADRNRYRGVVRNARLMSTAASGVGAALLIADLRTPRRWYNMFRIFRTTSPMSFGSYILTAFGAFSGLTALAEVTPRASRLRPVADRVANAAQLPAALAGAGAATYTASVLAATSTPLWAAAPRALGASSAAASVASAAAALSIGERWGGRHEVADRMDMIAAAACVAHLVASQTASHRRRDRGVDLPEADAVSRTDALLTGAVPLAAYAMSRLGRRSPAMSVLGCAALIAGVWLARHGTLKAGIASAEDPRSQFRLAQPERLPDRSRDRRLTRQGGF